MQLDTSVDASGRFCRVRVIGQMYASEYRAAAARFLEHPGVSPGIGIVYDLCAAQISQLTGDDFRAMREMNNAVAPRRGRAVGTAAAGRADRRGSRPGAGVVIVPVSSLLSPWP